MISRVQVIFKKFKPRCLKVTNYYISVR